jgi:hypothetical protein
MTLISLVDLDFLWKCSDTSALMDRSLYCFNIVVPSARREGISFNPCFWNLLKCSKNLLYDASRAFISVFIPIWVVVSARCEERSEETHRFPTIERLERKVG